MNAQETAICLRTLGAAYGHVEQDGDRAELWLNVFSGDDAVHVLTACREWVINESRWPTPADIRRYIRDAVRREQMDTPPPREIGQRYPTFDEGIQIAYESYCREVRRQGREPRSFEQFRGSVPVNREQRRRVASRR